MLKKTFKMSSYSYSEYREKLENEQKKIGKEILVVKEKERIAREKEKIKRENEEKKRKHREKILQERLDDDVDNITFEINYTTEHCGSCCGDPDSDHLNDEETVTINMIEIIWYLENFGGDIPKDKEDFFKHIKKYISYYLKRYYNRPTELNDFDFTVFKNDEKIELTNGFFTLNWNNRFG